MSSFYAFIGSDEGLVSEKAQALFQKLTGGNDDGFTHEIIEGSADSAEKAYAVCRNVTQALQTLPLFGGDKVVWLRAASFLGDSVTGRSQRCEEGLAILRQVIEAGLPAGLTLILTAREIDKRRSFWKFVEKSAQLSISDAVDILKEGWENLISRDIQQYASERGLQFERDALDVFISRVGTQSRQIWNELEKIDLFLSEESRTITLNLVQTLVPQSKESVIFEIGTAIQKGDAQSAIQLIDDQLEEDEKAAIGIMRASIINSVRNLFYARLAMDVYHAPTTNYSAFAKHFDQLPEEDRAWLPMKKDRSGVNAFPIFLAINAARSFSLSDLLQIMESTQRADQALVSSETEPRTVLHRLVLEIQSLKKRTPRSRS